MGSYQNFLWDQTQNGEEQPPRDPLLYINAKYWEKPSKADLVWALSQSYQAKAYFYQFNPHIHKWGILALSHTWRLLKCVALPLHLPPTNTLGTLLIIWRNAADLESCQTLFKWNIGITSVAFNSPATATASHICIKPMKFNQNKMQMRTQKIRIFLVIEAWTN